MNDLDCRRERRTSTANSYVVKPVDFDGFARAVAEIGCYWVVINEPPF